MFVGLFNIRFILLILHYCFPADVTRNLVVYPWPKGIESYSCYKVFAREKGQRHWREIFVNQVTVGVRNRGIQGKSGVVSFDSSFDEPIEIKVRLSYDNVEQVDLRPALNRQLKVLNAKEVTFFVLKAESISIEFNGDRINNLLLFANNMEVDVPEKQDPKVIYFAPGVHYIKSLNIKKDQLIYLAGGAIVRGKINIYDTDNITIRGRGILEGSSLNHLRSSVRENLLKVKNGNNIHISGITLVDSPAWTLFLDGCDSVKIDNVKIVSHMINGDGIAMSQSKNVNIRGVFIRTADDNISIKNLLGGTSKNILVSNSTLWADDAHNMLVGPESRGGYFNNIRFSKITVLENTQSKGLYSGVWTCYI